MMPITSGNRKKVLPVVSMPKGYVSPNQGEAINPVHPVSRCVYDSDAAATPLL
jgi:hypothetical protein